MKFKRLIYIFAAVALCGCAGMLPAERKIQFSGSWGEFVFVKTGCVLDDGKYTDRSGKGNRLPLIKFIALTEQGATVGQWYARCDAVVANGTSSCAISGPKKAYYECDNYKKFMLVN